MNRTLNHFAFGIAAIGLTAGAFVAAHPDDPKSVQTIPTYQGMGWRAGDANFARSGGPNFPASNVELRSWITVPEFPGNQSAANDCWGYTSPSGREYALVGFEDGTGFVEITDPDNPVIIDLIAGPSSIWRDLKTYQDHVYVVNETGGGVQVIDMSDIDNGNVTLLGSVGNSDSHNVAINTETGFLYRCGGDANGIEIYDLSNPSNPTLAGAWPDRYVHDLQVANFPDPLGGPDREIAILCGGLNGGFQDTGIDILDVTNKQNIQYLSQTDYPNKSYSHQAWLSPDKQYLYLNDETNEINFGINSTTHIFDMSDYANPVFVGEFVNGSPATTHNLYTRDDNLLFAANYLSGMRVLDISSPENPVEVGFFDTHPDTESAGTEGLWSVYPYFPSGRVIGSDRQMGLFVWDISSFDRLDITLPNAAPEIIDPSGDSFVVNIAEVEGSIDPTTAKLVYEIGTGPLTTDLVDLGGGQFEAQFPAIECGTAVSYYIAVSTQSGDAFTLPAAAPATAFDATVAVEINTSFEDDFNGNLNWVATNLGASSGDWQRGVPVDDPDWDYDPATDGDGSGAAYLTQNEEGNTDIDGGAVRLTSPALDMTGENVALSYQYYLRLTEADGVDRLLVEINSNGGAGSWTEIAVHEDNVVNWPVVSITGESIENLGVTLTDNMRIRFTANDSDPQSIVEAGVDAFRIIQILCDEDPGPSSPDLTNDGVVDTFDLLQMLDGWGACDEPCPPTCNADITGDGGSGPDCNVDTFDLLLLLENWTG